MIRVDMGAGTLKEWLLWLADRLIDANVSFSVTHMPDGQWQVGVADEVASNKVRNLMLEWKRDHEARA